MTISLPRRGYADGPFGQVHYQDTETGLPLVLCHQAPMSTRQFDQAYGPLAKRGIRAIGVDMPGFGMSTPTDFVPAIEDYAKVVPSVLDHLGIKQTFVLGHHTGAQMATEVALQFEDRVMGLIINGPFPVNEEERQNGLAWVESGEKNLEHKPDGSHLQEYFKMRMAFANEATDWKLATQYVCQPFMGFGPFWYGHHAAFQYDHGAAIPRITHPTLVLTNTGDQIYDKAQQVMAMRPDFSYAELEGGGIDIVDEMPAEWSEAVADFVWSVAKP